MREIKKERKKMMVSARMRLGISCSDTLHFTKLTEIIQSHVLERY